MTTLNRVFLMGNLTRDPEVRYTPSGTAVGDLSLAINENYKNKAGETVESTVFVEVEVWSRQAETCAEYLFKGSPVFVEGRLKLDQWTNQQGEKRSKLRVRADRVQFVGSQRRGADATDTSHQNLMHTEECEEPHAEDGDIPF
ncbi:MAG: single-stranded DNA-binding protein [Kiritimatiellaceae bacterium]|nr:single-stranded DNA-binding protein [Kiritimatiellaceae bacterium]